MPKRLTREQEKAMFATMHTDKTYKRSVSESNWIVRSDEYMTMPDTGDTVHVLTSADGDEYKISINHDINAGPAYGVKAAYWRKGDAITDAHRLTARYPNGFNAPEVPLGTQPQQTESEMAVKWPSKAESDAPISNTISKGAKGQYASIETQGVGSTKEYRVMFGDELQPMSFTSKKKAIKYIRSHGYSYSRRR